jgi:hypothetical protein
MPQSLAKILVHIVFSTKDRRAYLNSLPLRDELHHYLGGIVATLDANRSSLAVWKTTSIYSSPFLEPWTLPPSSKN